MNINEQKKNLTLAKGIRKQNNKDNKKKKKSKIRQNTNANCLASLDKWDPPN